VNIIWDERKNDWLKKERGISFDDAAALIMKKSYVDIIAHPKRPGQWLFVIPIRGYTHIVPFVIDRDNNFVLKTVYPSHKFHKKYGKETP
jgi:uncharacterized DUF497 family protein